LSFCTYSVKQGKLLFQLERGPVTHSSNSPYMSLTSPPLLRLNTWRSARMASNFELVRSPTDRQGTVSSTDAGDDEQRTSSQIPATPQADAPSSVSSTQANANTDTPAPVRGWWSRLFKRFRSSKLWIQLSTMTGSLIIAYLALKPAWDSVTAAQWSNAITYRQFCQESKVNDSNSPHITSLMED
jgi:hypothetical protein